MAGGGAERVGAVAELHRKLAGGKISGSGGATPGRSSCRVDRREADQDAGAVERAVGIRRPVGAEIAEREPIRQLQEPRAQARGHGPLEDLGGGLDEDARVLGVGVVGHVKGHARVVADMADPHRVLAPDDEEAPRVEVQLVPHRRDVRPALGRDRGDARIPRLREKHLQLFFREATDLVGRLEGRHGHLTSARGSKASRSRRRSR